MLEKAGKQTLSWILEKEGRPADTLTLARDTIKASVFQNYDNKYVLFSASLQ